MRNMNIFETTVKIHCSQKYLCSILSLGLKYAIDKMSSLCNYVLTAGYIIEDAREKDRKLYLKQKKKRQRQRRRKEVSCHRNVHACMHMTTVHIIKTVTNSVYHSTIPIHRFHFSVLLLCVCNPLLMAL